MAGQRQSTVSPDVAQLSLIPAADRKACPPVDVDYLLARPNSRRAMRYAMSLMDLEPKQIYEPLEMDKAIWSRIENGGMSFPIEKLKPFNALVRNDALLLWHVFDNGYDVRAMRKLQDDKDKRIEQLEAQLAEERAEKAAIAKFVRETMR
jgi:hypothetical protein